MNNSLILPLVFLASGNKGNQAGAFEAMLTASNQFPEASRTLFAVTQAVDRADREEQQQKALIQREIDLANLIDGGKITVPQDLSNDPRMQFMLDRLADQTLRASVETKLKAQPQPGTP